MEERSQKFDIFEVKFKNQEWEINCLKCSDMVRTESWELKLAMWMLWLLGYEQLLLGGDKNLTEVGLREKFIRVYWDSRCKQLI